MPTIRILAAIVDTAKLTLYKEDGSQLKIPQGDERLLPLLEQVKPLSNPVGFDLPTNDAGYPYVTIELGDEPEPEPVIKPTSYRDYEEKAQKAGGITRFFRVLKTKVSGLLKGGVEEDLVPSQVIGIVPDGPGETGPAGVQGPMGSELPLEPGSDGPAGEDGPTIEPKMSDALKDIMANAKPASDDSFHETNLAENETIVAVVDDGKGNARIIPEAEKLKGHLAHSVKTDNVVGMQTFLARLGSCIAKRGHTVEDLLRFMERGDLPIADDGSIIAYKVLKTVPGKGNDVFFDCHTGKIPQRVGSFVCQDERLIDPSRYTQCSTGLHIARRAYLRGFSGNIIVLVKFRPEDVIAVPTGEPDKIRVKGYHILAKVPADEHRNLRSNKEMQGTNALKQLTMAIKGEHIGIIEEVRITASHGGSYQIVPMDAEITSVPRPTKETAVTKPVQQDLPKAPQPKPQLNGPKVDPKALAKEIRSAKPVSTEGKLTQVEKAKQFLDAEDYAGLLAFKKASKKSWAALGITPAVEATIIAKTSDQTPAPAATKPEPAAKKEAPVAETQAPPAEKVSLKGTRAEVARVLFDQAAAGDRSRWKTLWLHRKECKKSWEILGFSPKEIERIKLNKPDSV